MAAITPALPQPGRAIRLPRVRSRLHALNYKWQVMLCTVVGTFMVMLDSTVVNIALPKITTVFGVGVHEAQLVITSYMLALAVVMPATGYLADTLGTKRMYLVTMALFTGGSLLCGLAWNNTSLVVFRVLQGLGGGMMTPLGMAMLFRAVPFHERNAMMGIYGLPMMAAPVLGPTLGGYIVEYVDWRVIFTLNIPVGIVGLLLGWTLLRETEHVPGLEFDLRGFVLSAVAFSSLLLGLTDAANDGWTAPHMLLRFAIGIVALVAWVWVELTDRHPLIELRLFKNSTFTLATLVNFVVTIGMFGSMILLPLFLQNFRGLGAAETGLLMISQALVMTVAMPIVGKLVDAMGPRAVLLVGLPLVAITTWQFGSLDLNTSDNQLRLMLAERGFAMALVMMPAMTTALNAIPTHLMSRASSMSNVLRQVFGSFGTALVVTILQTRQTFHQALLTQTATPDNLALQQVLAQAQQWVVAHGGSAAQGQATGLMLVYRQLVLTASIASFDDVFRITAGVTLVAILPALFLRPPRRVSGGRGESAILVE